MKKKLLAAILGLALVSFIPLTEVQAAPASDNKVLIKQLSQQIKASPYNREILRKRGLAYLDNKQYTKAIKDFNAAMEFGDKASWYYCALAYKADFNYTEAIKTLEEAVPVPELGITQEKINDELANLYVSRHDAYWKNKKYEKALETGKDLIAFNPAQYANHEYYRRIAVCNYRLDKYSDAIEYFDLALSKDPQDDYSLGLRGHCKLILKDYWGAIDDLNSSLNINPNGSDSYINYYNRGCCYQLVGYLSSALADFTKVIQLKPDLTLAYNLRAQVLNDLGRYNEAKEDFRIALNAGVINDVPEHYKEYYEDNHLTCPVHGGRFVMGGCQRQVITGTRSGGSINKGGAWTDNVYGRCGKSTRVSVTRWRLKD